MNDCLFCKFADGRLQTEKVYEDDKLFIIRDISPKAEKHYLLIPKKHYPLLEEMDAQSEAELGGILKKISALKSLLGLEKGYRLTINQGEDAGQTVMHLHIHVMGGQELDFPDYRK